MDFKSSNLTANYFLLCTDCTSNQFRCSNGECISRCNYMLNCIDGSDEIGCSELEDEYINYAL